MPFRCSVQLRQKNKPADKTRTEDIQEGNTPVYSCTGISQEFGKLVEKQEAVKSLVIFPKKSPGKSTLQKTRAGARVPFCNMMRQWSVCLTSSTWIFKSQLYTPFQRFMCCLKLNITLFFFRIAAISIATKLTDLQLGDSVEISRLITKKEMKQAR